MVDVPCKDRTKRSGKSTVRVPVVLPHEMLNYLAETGRFRIHPSLIQEFWKRWAAHKPFHPAAGGAAHCPLALTGDDAKYTLGGAKVIVIAMSLTLLDRGKSKGPNDLLSSSFAYIFEMFEP